jgi:hypothetical protein
MNVARERNDQAPLRPFRHTIGLSKARLIGLATSAGATARHKYRAGTLYQEQLATRRAGDIDVKDAVSAGLLAG